jgi:hypothetical protein
MAKRDDPSDLTIGYNAKVLAAIKTIGQGLMDLADALVAPEPSEPKPRPADRSQTSQPPAEEEQQPDEQEETKEIELSDLQELARDLIKAKRRPQLIKILEGHELENVSSAPAEIWADLKKELKEAAA